MLQWLFGKSKEDDPPKRKQTKEEEAEDKWKYDFLVQFLSGPVWKVSILDFVDYHCVVFDNEEQNKFEYTTIHKQFKELVATLFDGMMQEVGLDDEKLAELLQQGFASKHKKIFNQLLLADDFLRFKQLMVSRNKTLEAEAIKALAESPKKTNRISEQDLLRESQTLEMQRKRKLELDEEEQLRKVLEMSKIQAEEQSMIKKLEEKTSKIQQVQQVKEPVNVQKAPEVTQKVEKSGDKPEEEKSYLPNVRTRNKKSAPIQPLPPLRQTKKQESPVHVEEKPQPPVVIEQKVEIPVQKTEVESQQDRRKRLLEQRQRIRRKKQEQRHKQATEEEGNHPVQTIVLQQDGIHETHMEEPKKEKVSQQEIDRRRELMKKIKNRIVDDF